MCGMHNVQEQAPYRGPCGAKPVKSKTAAGNGKQAGNRAARQEAAIYREALCRLYEMTKDEANSVALDALCRGDRIAGRAV